MSGGCLVVIQEPAHNIPESGETITIYNTQFRGYFRSLTSEMGKRWIWWNRPMDSGHMEGSCLHLT